VTFTSDEVTSFCPVTEQPDFNTVTIEYHPDELCVESKSLKLYLWTFRDERIFGEGLAHTIAQELYEALRPFYIKVTLVQSIRGGLQMTAVAEMSSKP
jgi:7-cyano-7-deazaguanine reductase